MAKQWYGSINNRLSEKTFQGIPYVGMGAYISYWSDREPYTVTEVSKETIKFETKVRHQDGSVTNETRVYPRWIIAVQDDYKIISGSMQYGSAEFEFTPGTGEGVKFIFHKKSGLYRQETTKWVEDPSITLEVANEKSLKYHNGYYIPSNRTNQESTAIILGYRSKYYDPSF